ncbi:MAG TPA: hypothetical protein VD866_32265 [Urbifossiella sp.]|nr:hypothetical protein [Urbifossiella sp.]
MASTDPNWLPLAAAAERIGKPYETVRRLAKEGVFTKGTFGGGAKRPHVSLRVDELDAYKRGGIEELRRLQDRRSKKPHAKAGA